MPLDALSLPASIAATPCRDRRLVVVRTGLGIVELADHFLQRAACDGAFVRIERGIVPVLLQHAKRWDIEASIGTVREARFDGDAIELIAEFGANPKAAWIWDDLRAGFTFGCSVGLGHFKYRDIAAELPKPLRLSESWWITELTLCAPGGGADSEATVRFAHNARELLAELQAQREARAELRGRALPEDYAGCLRERLGDMAVAVAHAADVDDVDQVRGALAAEIEQWIADWRGSSR